MRSLIVALLFALPAGLAVNLTPPEPIALGTPFVLKVGEFAVLKNSDWVLTFVRVVSDSRCSPKVQCVWAGDATLELRARRNSQRDTVPFHLNTLSKTSATALEQRVTLVELGVKPAKSATFRITQP
jgi:hypothetical protein